MFAEAARLSRLLESLESLGKRDRFESAFGLPAVRGATTPPRNHAAGAAAGGELDPRCCTTGRTLPHRSHGPGRRGSQGAAVTAEGGADPPPSGPGRCCSPPPSGRPPWDRPGGSVRKRERRRGAAGCAGHPTNHEAAGTAASELSQARQRAAAHPESYAIRGSLFWKNAVLRPNLSDRYGAENIIRSRCLSLEVVGDGEGSRDAPARRRRTGGRCPATTSPRSWAPAPGPPPRAPPAPPPPLRRAATECRPPTWPALRDPRLATARRQPTGRILQGV